MKRFDYLAPSSFEEALDMLVQRPAAMPLAGGTDLVLQMKEDLQRPEALLSLRQLPQLREIALEDGMLRLGPTVTAGRVASHSQVCDHFTALAEGAGLIGSVQICNMATVGGNVCNASPAADTPPGLIALNAVAILSSRQGERTVPLDAFFTGPRRTVMQPGELLREIRVPRPPSRSGSAYLRHTPRAWMDIAFVGVAAMIGLSAAGVISDARIVLAAVAPLPIRALAAEQALVGERPDDTLFQRAAQIASAEARPIDDVRASADYRRHIVAVLTGRALRRALGRAERANGD